jgi:hypothetical protein
MDNYCNPDLLKGNYFPKISRFQKKTRKRLIFTLPSKYKIVPLHHQNFYSTSAEWGSQKQKRGNV